MAGSFDDDRRIAVSPLHSVLLAREYLPLIERAPKADFVVRTVAQREVGDLLLMTAELVIAGEPARKLHPLAAAYPLHFKKTYFPAQMHREPQKEFDAQTLASRIVSGPPPIGYSDTEIRTCLLPGEPLRRLSPFGIEPEGANLAAAEKLALSSAVGLWHLAGRALASLVALHEAGLAHGDAELQNCIVCSSPIETYWVDFEGAARQAEVAAGAWEGRLTADLAPLLREAALLQCALGRQSGRLADLSWESVDQLFGEPERVRRAIQRQAEL